MFESDDNTDCEETKDLDTHLHEADTLELQNEFDQSRNMQPDTLSHKSSDCESEEYNLSASYTQHEADSLESHKEFDHDRDNNASDILSDDDFSVKKPTQRHRNVIESDSDDEETCNSNVSSSPQLHKNFDHAKNTRSEIPPDHSSDFDKKNLKQKFQSTIESVIDSDETYDLHEADTLELHKEIANISTELSKSRISVDEIVSDADKTNVLSSSTPEKNHSVRTEDVANYTPKPNRIRISEEFSLDNFGKVKNMLHSSTLIEPQLMLDTPVNNSSGKRLLNKSIETPRILKLAKESNTPRVIKPLIPSRSPSPEIQSLSEDDIIDVSSEEESIIKAPAKTSISRIQKQATLDSMFVKKEMPTPVKEDSSILVSLNQLQEQQDKIRRIRSDLSKATNLLRTVNLENLPDKGKSIRNRNEFLEDLLLEEVAKMSKMKVTHGDERNKKPGAKEKIEILSWDEIAAKAGAVVPRTFGKQAMSTYNAQKAVTMDRLQQLHGSLATCPKESDTAVDPKGLKVELMPHQRRALAWLMWRETQTPSGGILADDMGLGKTLTMISLMLKTNETEEDDDSDEENAENVPKKKKTYKGGTLVVCPASLINQWSSELERRTKRGLASCEMYHGAKRETNPKRLAKHDMVVTTYSIVNNECEKEGAVFRVKWRRIVIDEAHQIRNHKSQTSDAVCRLSARSRWALTGTPVHNKELDMYALLKFLRNANPRSISLSRCTPFDDLSVWKRWVGDKSTGGTERLHTVISSLMLRRTKAELMEKGTLNSLPERKWELIPVDLSKPERDVYGKILIFSRTLFAQFLHQRADKNGEATIEKYSANQQPNGPNQEYFQMRQKLLRLNNIKDVKQHEILVLLLRLRQICCHPSLITGMLHEDMELMGDEDQLADKRDALDFLDQLNNLTIADDAYNPNSDNVAQGIGEEALGLKEAARGVLNPSDPVFSKESMSSKIKVMLRVLREKVIANDDKAIIVSQWSSYLNLISQHLRTERIVYEQLDGTVPVPKRMDMVDRFNDPKDKMRVLLLSLTAGGVGLNLVGANHLFLLDLHWNPQLENQAQDRIYRMGQQKPVFVYKFMATDTIENRILELQEKKLSIANSMLTGTKQAITSKLSLQDLKMLFEM
ncbi:unnamed protein product [Phaedon cochleariae]|uniref:Transcription termination factor 2 n=1 Tax=Phaedon cochleariae TaxID=80249 RepID=A0A9N9SFI0_PHACE|nr:unnamed protein product [Phaedon cochleariae]